MKKIYLYLMLSLLVASSISEQASADVLVIVNPDVNETDLSKKEVKDIFLGKRVMWKLKFKDFV